ncbi:MFS transporter [Nocardia sp. NPDC050697]|uniref:MFS transporter n=1 Tax=Nocardia sp. NPDC050697 TaxID=3155158 RepID=UPI0033D34DED
MLAPLRDRTFRRLFLAQVVALAGTGLLTVALGLLAYDLAGPSAGVVLGTALVIKIVAYVGVAPVVAACTERVPRRVLLVSADALRAGVALLLPFAGQVWQVYVLIAVLQAASATFTPAFQAIIPAVLPRPGEYTAALSLSRLAYDLEAVLSPLLAAAALTVLGYNALFVGTVFGFLGSAVLVAGTALPALPVPERNTPLRTRIGAGAAVMVARPPLAGLLALNAVVAAATALVLVNTVVYVRGPLGGGDTGVAVALGCFGAGSMLVALLLPALLRSRDRDRTVVLAGAATVVGALAGSTVLLLTGVHWATLAAAWTLLGAGTALIATPAARLIRDTTAEDERAPVFTAQFSLSHACYLLTYPLAGWAGALAGHAFAAAALTLVATLATITAVRLWPARRPAARAPAVTGKR